MRWKRETSSSGLRGVPWGKVRENSSQAGLLFVCLLPGFSGRTAECPGIAQGASAACPLVVLVGSMLGIPFSNH